MRTYNSCKTIKKIFYRPFIYDVQYLGMRGCTRHHRTPCSIEYLTTKPRPRRETSKSIYRINCIFCGNTIMLSRAIKAIIIVITIHQSKRGLRPKIKRWKKSWKGMKEIPNESEICLRLTLLKGSRVI